MNTNLQIELFYNYLVSDFISENLSNRVYFYDRNKVIDICVQKEMKKEEIMEFCKSDKALGDREVQTEKWFYDLRYPINRIIKKKYI